ncbi:hypothetical protein D3C80_1216660 [compost metagenome]
MSERAAISNVQPLGLKAVQVKAFVLHLVHRLALLGLEKRFQATGRACSLRADRQVALGKKLDRDDQELAFLGRLEFIQWMLGQLETMTRLHLAHAALPMDASGSRFVLLNLHAAQPVATVRVLPGILPTVLITLEIGWRRRCRQRRGSGDL